MIEDDDKEEEVWSLTPKGRVIAERMIELREQGVLNPFQQALNEYDNAEKSIENSLHHR